MPLLKGIISTNAQPSHEAPEVCRGSFGGDKLKSDEGESTR